MSDKKPSANKKLKNVEAVTKMLRGEHFSQTKTVSGWTPKQDSTQRKVGEVWYEYKPNGVIIEWTQKKGYRTKKRKNLKSLYSLRDYLDSYNNCHNKDACTAKGTRLDQKFKKVSGRCADCHFEFERKLKEEGEFDEYAKNYMVDRIKGFLKQAEQEKEAIKKGLEDVVFPNQDGSGDKFEVYNKEKILEKIDSDFEKLKENLLKDADGSTIEYE